MCIIPPNKNAHIYLAHYRQWIQRKAKKNYSAKQYREGLQTLHLHGVQQLLTCQC